MEALTFALLTLTSLQAAPADTVSANAIPHTAPILADARPSSPSTLHPDAAMSLTSERAKLEELAETLEIDVRALMMMRTHPEAPERVLDITATPAILDHLSELYEHSEMMEAEQVVCLAGEVRGETVHLTDTRRPTVHEADFWSVSYNAMDCLAPDFAFVGILHTHPTLMGIRMCRPSETDLTSFLYLQRAVVGVVLCGPDQVAYMSHDSDQPIRRRQLMDGPRLPLPLPYGEEVLPTPALHTSLR